MKLRIMLLLAGVLLLLGTGPASAMHRLSGAAEPRFTMEQPALHVSTSDPEGTRISLLNPDIGYEDVVVNGRTFRSFSLDGEPGIMVEGAPSLPAVTRLYKVPDRGGIELASLAENFDVMSDVNPLPITLEDTDAAPAGDPAIFDSDAWYPESPIAVGAPMVLRNIRVVAVTFYPVQVNPITREARIYTRLEAHLTTTGGPGEKELVGNAPASSSFDPALRGMVANLGEESLKAMKPLPGRYLILCKDTPAVLTELALLVAWKQRLGFTVELIARNNWSTITMAQEIRTRYNDPTSPPVEFVCIVGDPNANAFYSMPTNATDDTNETDENPYLYDHPFACMDQDDLEDVAVGRLPASSASELHMIIAKILKYESTPYLTDPSWFTHGALMTGIGHEQNPDYYPVRSNLSMANWVAQRMVQGGITNTQQHFYDTTVNAAEEMWVNDQLLPGAGYFLWRGNNVNDWSFDSASWDAAMAVSPALPVMLGITCMTGSFQRSQPCFSEYWVRAGTIANPKGGVACVSTAGIHTHPCFNNTIFAGMAYNIFDLGVQHLGVSLNAAKAQLYRVFPNDLDHAHAFSCWNNLMGDPALSLWTRTPRQLEVSHVTDVLLGTQQSTVVVTDAANGQPVVDALVVWYKAGECFARGYTGADGLLNLPVTSATVGTMTLTVSKRNYVPYLADVNCTTPVSWVSIASYTLTDQTVNPGDNIGLTVSLQNTGTALATGISAHLSSPDPLISVTAPGWFVWPNLGPGMAAAGPAFSFHVSQTMPHNHPIRFQLDIQQNGVVSYNDIHLVSIAGRSAFVSTTVSGGDGNNYLSPGETANLTVTLLNDGGISLPSLNGQLISRSPYVDVPDGAATFGTIAAGQQGSNSTNPFVVRAHRFGYPATLANFLALMTPTPGAVDTVAFALPLGPPASTDPTGPDAYGYYAYEDTDAGYAPHRLFNYVAINTAGGENLNLQDRGDEWPEDPINSVYRALPFPFRFYGHDYIGVSICSNGWVGFGHQETIDFARNFPIPGQEVPGPMIAPLWDDLKTVGAGLGVWVASDPVNHRYIIQWRAQGACDAPLQDFEVILLDPAWYPAPGGNGTIVVQYQSVTDMIGCQASPNVPYSTIGIASADGITGLQYRFNNVGAPGASPLAAGRCVVYTTEVDLPFGRIAGTARDLETGDPASGIIVRALNESYRDTTGASGNYWLDHVSPGTYTIQAAPAYGPWRRINEYLPAVVPDVPVAEFMTTALNFSLERSTFEVQTDMIKLNVPPDAPEAWFVIQNGPKLDLTYTITPDNAPGWLAIVPPSGSVAPKAATKIYLKFDTKNLAIGTYTTNLTIARKGDDECVVLPVILNVTAAKMLIPELTMISATVNPFTAGTTIRLDLTKPGPASVGVFDLQGRRVRTLLEQTVAAGSYSLPWDGRDEEGLLLPSGVYFCRLRTPSGEQSHRLVRLK